MAPKRRRFRAETKRFGFEDLEDLDIKCCSCTEHPALANCDELECQYCCSCPGFIGNEPTIECGEMLAEGGSFSTELGAADKAVEESRYLTFLAMPGNVQRVRDHICCSGL